MKRKNQLKLSPVNSYQAPAYPDRSQVESEPSLLLKHVPRAWLKKPLAAGILIVISAGGHSAAADVGQSSSPKHETVAPGDISKQETRVEKEKNKGIIAPYFFSVQVPGLPGAWLCLHPLLSLNMKQWRLSPMN